MKKRLLAMIMTLAMCLSLLPTAAFATGNEETPAKPSAAQIVSRYFVAADDEETVTDETTNDAVKQTTLGKVQVSKTITGTDTENVFDVTLQVKTKQDIKEVPQSTDAAIVLILDRSYSMECCMRCGYYKDNDVHKMDACSEEGCGCTKYEKNWNSTNCKSCNHESTKHTEARDHAFDSNNERRDVAETKAIAFIDQLRQDAVPGDHRYISVVSFAKNDKIECDWVDIMTNAGYASVKNAIVTTFSTTEFGTDMKKGFDTASAKLVETPEDGTDVDISKIANRYAVLLTDGKPTPNGDSETTRPFCDQVADAAEDLSDVAILHSICFAAEQDQCYKGDGTNDKVSVKTFLEGISDACYTANNAGELQTAFAGISQVIKLMAQAWEVKDPMGENMIFVSEDHPAASCSNDVLTWNLKADTPINISTATVDGKEETTYTYKLTYRVKLDTLANGFGKDQEYATNGYTYLTYVFYNENNELVDEEGNPTRLTSPNEISFNVPIVKGYAGDLSFKKVGSNTGDAGLAGATFQVKHADTCPCGAGESNVKDPATSVEGTGAVQINDIPSGHDYVLVETNAPENYIEAENIEFTVSYGDVYVDGKEAPENWTVENVYNPPTPTTGSLTITKVYDANSEIKDTTKEFFFTVTGPNDYSSTVTVKAGESKTISGLAFGEYTVTEESAAVANYELATSYSVADGKVTIDAGNNNAAVVTVTNKYTAIPATPDKLVISGAKVVSGVGAPSETFTFQLKKDDKVVDTATRTGEGSFSFDELTFNSVGTYTYTVSEVAGDNTEWAYDNTVYTVTVDVTKDASKNELVATYKVDNETNKPIAFTNTFTPANGQLTIIKVDAANQDTKLAGAVFTLTPNEEGEVITATSGDNGVATFNSIPLGTYTLTETTAPVGYLESKDTYTVTVTAANGNTTTSVLKVGETADNTANISGEITIENVKKVANTTIAKAANKDEAYAPGETVTYTVTLTNSGNIDDTVTVVDTLPAALVDATEHNITATGATVSYENYTITWNSVTVLAGKTTTLTYTVVIPENVTLGEHANTVAIQGTNKTDSETIQVEAAKLTATKEAAPTVAPGGTLTYTIKVTNTGNKAAENVVITDVIPTGLEFVSATEGGINNAGTVTWNIASIGAANAADDTDQKTVSVTVKVPESAANGTKYENTAIVNGGNTNKTTTVVDNLSASIGGTKVVKQGGNVAAPAEEFTFNLSLETVNEQAPEQAYTQTVSAVAGPFSFSPIKYTEPGTYVYKVSETKGSAADWTYDSTVYTVTVTVDRGDDGKLVAEVDGNEGITFTNTYTKTQSTGGGSYTPNIPDNPPALNKVDHFAYIVGYPDGNVMPNGNITRAEVATIFFRMLTDESRDEFWSQSSDYSDVTATKWFNNAVCTLSNGGIITGYADGTFKPNGNITRAEFATMAVRFFSASYEGESLFPDIDQHWAKDYINTAAYEGLINGYEDGTFRPNQPITRAEAMAIVNRVLDRHPDKDNLLEDMIQWPDNMDTEKWYYADVQEATNSHDYDMEGTEAEPYEVWTEILPVRDWVAFEKEWSDSNSAEGGEVMK